MQQPEREVISRGGSVLRTQEGLCLCFYCRVGGSSSGGRSGGSVVHYMCAEVEVWLVRLQKHYLSPCMLDEGCIGPLQGFIRQGGETDNQAREYAALSRMIALLKDERKEGMQTCSNE